MATSLSRNAGAVAPPPHHLSNIQVLRGIAAVMVVVYHIGNELGDRGFPDAFPGLWAGSAGVDIFFVVSGFIMVYSTAGAFAKPGAPALFLARRLVRLVPLYWIVTTIAAVALVRQSRHMGLPGETVRWIAASYAFLFYPHGEGGDFPIYAQGWTLNFEMFFYVCFAAVLSLRRPVALWTLAIGLSAFVALGLVVTLPWPIQRWAETNIIEFVLGLALAVAYARGIRLSRWVALALAAAGFATFALTIGSVDDWLPLRGFVWGPPALAVVAAATLHRPSSGGPLRRMLEALGDASYALYLVHYAVFVWLGDGLGRLVAISTLPPLLYAGLCFTSALVVAFATHRLVERPLTRGLNRALGLSRRWRALTEGARVGS